MLGKSLSIVCFLTESGFSFMLGRSTMAKFKVVWAVLGVVECGSPEREGG